MCKGHLRHAPNELLAKGLNGYEGDYEEALKHHREGLALSEELGDRSSLAICHCNIGDACLKMGDLGEAERSFLESFKINTALGDRAGLAVDHLNLGHIKRGRSDGAGAFREYAASLQISEELGNRVAIAECYGYMSLAHGLLGDRAKAKEMGSRAEGLYRELGLPMPEELRGRG